MNEEISKYLSKYPCEILELFQQVRQLIFDSAASAPEETLWARMPSYYVGDSFVRLIPFKDHINIEAKAVMNHKTELAGYKITPKGMLQIYVKQDIPNDILKQIFAETL